MYDYDVAVIGAGPGGYVAAIRCAQLGMKTVCIDKWVNDKAESSPGGTCLNAGCIPSKALLDSSHLYESISKQAQDHGLEVSVKNLNLERMHARKDNIIGNFSKGISGLFRKNSVEHLPGTASFVDKNRIAVTDLQSDVNEITARHIIVATGSVPGTISVAGIGTNIIDSEGALALDEVPVDLGIIGAGVIGLELGSVWRRLGANVTLIEAQTNFLPGVDKDVAGNALSIFRSQGLDIILGANILETEDDDDYVTLTYSDGKIEKELEFDKLIVAAGRNPNTGGLAVENAGIETDSRGFIVTDEYCRTSADTVYAIGDVTNGPMLAHRASYDGILVAEAIAGNSRTRNYDHIPWIIYTWPEIAWCGRTEQELIKSGISYKKGRFPFMANGRAHAMHSAEGFVKLLSSESGEILGLHIIGPNASELINAGVTAMSNHLGCDDIISEIHAHPTLTETLHEAALDIENRAIHI